MSVPDESTAGTKTPRTGERDGKKLRISPAVSVDRDDGSDDRGGEGEVGEDPS